MASKLGTRTKDRAPAVPKTKSDAYVGMLALALLAQIAGAAFLWLDYSSFGDKKPPAPPARQAVDSTPKQPDQPK